MQIHIFAGKMSPCFHVTGFQSGRVGVLRSPDTFLSADTEAASSPAARENAEEPLGFLGVFLMGTCIIIPSGKN